jgi:hypothetical protein
VPDLDISDASHRKEKATQKRLFNSTLMIADQAAVNADSDFLQYAMKLYDLARSYLHSIFLKLRHNF